jgi:hypothetical protein
MKVWDCCARSEEYLLVNVEKEDDTIKVSADDIDKAVQEHKKRHVREISRYIIFADREMAPGHACYGDQPDLGSSVVNAFRTGLFNTPDFCEAISKEVQFLL